VRISVRLICLFFSSYGVAVFRIEDTIEPLSGLDVSNVTLMIIVAVLATTATFRFEVLSYIVNGLHSYRYHAEQARQSGTLREHAFGATLFASTVILTADVAARVRR